jgi:hypothetical protein
MMNNNSNTLKALRLAHRFTPHGQYYVDADALRKARAGTPKGEYHSA